MLGFFGQCKGPRVHRGPLPGMSQQCDLCGHKQRPDGDEVLTQVTEETPPVLIAFVAGFALVGGYMRADARVARPNDSTGQRCHGCRCCHFSLPEGLSFWSSCSLKSKIRDILLSKHLMSTDFLVWLVSSHFDVEQCQNRKDSGL